MQEVVFCLDKCDLNWSGWSPSQLHDQRTIRNHVTQYTGTDADSACGSYLRRERVVRSLRFRNLSACWQSSPVSRALRRFRPRPRILITWSHPTLPGSTC